MVATIAEQPFTVANIPVSSWSFAIRIWLATILALFVSFRARAAAPPLNGASDVKLRFEMKLLQASESCSRSHNDLACFCRANPRKDASDL